MGFEFWMLALCALLLLVLGLLSFLWLDSDLTLLRAAWMGQCPENGNLKEKDILVLPLDLADTSSHDIATKTVLQEFGRIDILVNNGGIVHASLFENTNLDVFKVLIEVNYFGTVSLTKCVLPHMMERKQGKIVVMNSLVGIVPNPLCSGYIASKFALRVRLLQLSFVSIDCNGCGGFVHHRVWWMGLRDKVGLQKEKNFESTGLNDKY
uniref:Dehydrogenase/reductase SDR family member 7-like n=1 Tax=Rattus norvegicus TaxID=10116 RepID=A0ABK0LQU1_RAT